MSPASCSSTRSCPSTRPIRSIRPTSSSSSAAQNLRAVFAEALARASRVAGEITDRIDPETLARIFQAVADGLQLQWMLEPDVDMAGIVAQLFDALTLPTKDKNPE